MRLPSLPPPVCPSDRGTRSFSVPPIHLPPFLGRKCPRPRGGNRAPPPFSYFPPSPAPLIFFPEFVNRIFGWFFSCTVCFDIPPSPAPLFLIFMPPRPPLSYFPPSPAPLYLIFLPPPPVLPGRTLVLPD